MKVTIWQSKQVLKLLEERIPKHTIYAVASSGNVEYSCCSYKDNESVQRVSNDRSTHADETRPLPQKSGCYWTNHGAKQIA